MTTRQCVARGALLSVLLALVTAGPAVAGGPDPPPPEPKRVERTPATDRGLPDTRVEGPPGVEQTPPGPDTTVEVRAALFNEAAAALEPFRMRGYYSYTVDLPVFGETEVCGDTWTAQVDGVRFAIAADAVHVSGNVVVRWCDQRFVSALRTTADVSYDAGGNVFLVYLAPTRIRPKLIVKFMRKEYQVTLPVTIDISAVVFPPVPVSTVFFAFETASGTRSVRLTPRDLALIRKDGLFELQANLKLW